mgnify:CR=1 FL=1
MQGIRPPRVRTWDGRPRMGLSPADFLGLAPETRGSRAAAPRWPGSAPEAAVANWTARRRRSSGGGTRGGTTAEALREHLEGTWTVSGRHLGGRRGGRGGRGGQGRRGLRGGGGSLGDAAVDPRWVGPLSDGATQASPLRSHRPPSGPPAERANGRAGHAGPAVRSAAPSTAAPFGWLAPATDPRPPAAGSLSARPATPRGSRPAR